MPRFIDISVALEDAPMTPANHRPRIEYKKHDETWDGFRKYYPGSDPQKIVDVQAWPPKP